MKEYDFRSIEKRWQKRWLEGKVFKAREDTKKPIRQASLDMSRDKRGKPKYYQLETFPYPSAAGLHVGHPKGYIAEDIHARYMRMQGREVLYTMGWDAFGLPTENYAIKIGKSPKVVAAENIKNFKRQVQMFGFSYDWDREINTSSPEYYKWTQWLFIQLFKKGLAYRAKAKVNWCPNDKTVLANEQVVNGCCERCEVPVEQREMDQWFFKITDYAERLLADLDGLDPAKNEQVRLSGASWPEATIKRQKDWIGKSEGAELDFEIKTGANFVLIHGYGGSPDKHFIPWLKKELENRGYKVQVPELPNAKNPNVSEQIEYVLKNTRFDEKTVVLGHSLGSVVAMKVVEKLKQSIQKLVLVAGFSLPPSSRGHSRDYEESFNWKFDFRKIRKNVGEVVILRADIDTHVPPEQADILQRNLGGRVVDCIAGKEHFRDNEEQGVLWNTLDKITVFTTRPDTLFGATYMVLAPEHPLVVNLKSQISNLKEVEAYIDIAKRKTELERKKEGNDPSSREATARQGKTGVELKGVKAINPATKEEIPVWVADYVLGSVGTGAIMAVPAHDERDFEFAKRFGLPVRQVIDPLYVQTTEPGIYRNGEPIVRREGIITIVKHWSEDKYICLKWKKVDWRTFITGGVEKGQNAEQAGIAEIREETGYLNAKFVSELGMVHGLFYHVPKKENRLVDAHILYFELQDDYRKEISEEESAIHDISWLTAEELQSFLTPGTHRYALALFQRKLKAYSGTGVLTNSGKFTGMESEKAKWEITKFVGGEKKIQYKLRDWSVSRQRYWGTPIPIIYCSRCLEIPNPKSQITNNPQIQNSNIRATVIDGREHAIISVPEEDLPVKLPPLENYRPKGVPPLASSKEFIKVRCPKCGGDAKRDPETLDTFVDSSWYYLAYAMQGISNFQFPISNYEKVINYWMPVDLYVIGAEHTVLHLLYSRFITKFLHDEGYLRFSEPFLKLRHQGLILGEDGQKMSKSKGNVVNPDELIEEFGADTVRLYEMFMGPFEHGQPWDSKGVLGVHRFLNRLWGYINSVNEKLEKLTDKQRETLEKDLSPNAQLHRTLKKVGEDIENFKFNTAISSLMILVNYLTEGEAGVEDKRQAILSREDLGVFIKLFHPFAPHMAQELWLLMGYDSYLDFESWPEYDQERIKENTFTLVIQVNGKVRDSIEVAIDIGEEEAKDISLSRERIKKFIGTKKPKRIIYVPGKLVNIVL